MKWICVMSAVLAMVASATPAEAACPVPPGAVKVALPSGLPLALRGAIGNIALPGEPFLDYPGLVSERRPLMRRPRCAAAGACAGNRRRAGRGPRR